MIALPQRQEIVADIKQAHQAGARLAAACAQLGLSVRTYERWQQKGEVRADARPLAVRPEPAHKLTQEERSRVLAICHEPRFADLPPAQIVPRLADEGVYVASESSFYRVLRQAGQQHHRGRSQAPVTNEPARHVAQGPNEIWSWDVTYLPSRVRGMFFYLYAVIDLFSRKLVAWEVHERESGDDAAELIERACWREQRLPTEPLILHADNGAAQTAHTLKSKLETLGITPSHSRPGVSDDNAHIEAWFRTCKYAPSYPSNGFATIEEARAWVLQFVTWYNGEHLHSALAYVTPEQRHSGQANAILTHRRAVYAAARAQHPLRWKRATRSWEVPDRVWLNPPSKQDQQLSTA
jgi:transposase InsO family protein